MTDPVPSKEQDYLAKLQDSHPMVQLQREVDRLQRQQTNLIAALGEAQAKIDELSIHAEKWVKRALGSDQSWYGGQVNEEACKTLVRLNREARELAASAYQDGYGEALTDDRDLSERTHELMRRLSRPAHEREMPHCSTCACPPYQAPEPVTRQFKVGDEVPIAHWGATSKIVSIHCTLENGETIAVDCMALEPADEPDELMQWVEQWAEAYPLDMFPKPDLHKARDVLSAAGLSLDCISADAMRHVITRVRDRMRAAKPPVDVRSVDCPACGKPMSEHKGDLKPGAVLWCP